MEDILTELDKLIEKQKKSKLSGSDIPHVAELIKKLVTQETGREKLPAILVALPPEIGAQSVFGVIEDLDLGRQMDLLSTIIRSADFDKHPGYMRQLELAKILMPLPHLAMYLLLNLGEKVTEGGNKQASPSILKKFADDFLHESGVLSLNLDDSIGDVQLASLSIIVVGSLVEGRMNSDLMKKVLEWLKASERKLVIPKQLKRKLENDTKLWDTGSKTILLRLGLIDRLVDADHLPSEVTVTYLPNDTNGSVESKSSGQTSAHHEMKAKLPNQSEYDKIRSLLDELEAKSKRADEEILRLKGDLMRVENTRAYTQRRLEEAERSLSVANNHIQSLENMNQELSRKVNMLENLLVQKEKEYEKNRHELMDMSEHQSEFKTEVFKNKLRKKLRIEYLDFCEVESGEMTLRLGENLRMQVKNIFSILESEGIVFDGGSNE